MKINVKKFLKRLISLKNVVPLLVIVAAFIATVQQNPFGLQPNQVILVLLAFLAIDSLVERLETLSNIEEDIKRVKDLAESQFSGRNMLRHREDFRRLDQIIAEARQEIWVSGITLATMTTLTALFQQKAEEGVKLRFLGVTPDDNLGEEMTKYFGYDKDEVTARVKVNLLRLYNQLVRGFPNNVELRTTTHRLASGYFIVDPDSDQGHMTATAYLYQIQDSQWSPMLFLCKRTDSHWFTIYLDDFKRLWNDATEWTPDQ